MASLLHTAASLLLIGSEAVPGVSSARAAILSGAQWDPASRPRGHGIDALPSGAIYAWPFLTPIDNGVHPGMHETWFGIL